MALLNYGLTSFPHSFMALLLFVETDYLSFELSEFPGILHRVQFISKLAVNLVLNHPYYRSPNFSWTDGTAYWNVGQIPLYFHAKQIEHTLSDGILDIRISRF